MILLEGRKEEGGGRKEVIGSGSFLDAHKPIQLWPSGGGLPELRFKYSKYLTTGHDLKLNPYAK